MDLVDLSGSFTFPQKEGYAWIHHHHHHHHESRFTRGTARTVQLAEVGCCGAMVAEKSKKATKSQKGAVKRAVKLRGGVGVILGCPAGT